MKTKTNRKAAFFALGTGIAFSALVATPAQAAGTAQLGILDTSGTNPATGVEWQPGDTYHLIYVTTATRNAASTVITDYNSFIDTDAASQTGKYSQMGSVNWFALGSTALVDAIDNAVISAPVMGAFDSGAVAVDATDFWDFNWPDPNPIYTLSGENKNVWTGTQTGGTADAADELGAVDGGTRRHWTGWTSWGPAFATQTNTDELPLVGISEQLTVVPEPSTTLLIGLGSLALLRRRR